MCVGHRRTRRARSSPNWGPRSSDWTSADRPSTIKEFHEVDLADPASIDRAVASVGGQVDALFNVAGVSSGIGDPLLVVTINFLGLRHLTEALLPKMAAGSSIVSVSSLAASAIENICRSVAPTAEYQRRCERHRLVSRPSAMRWPTGLPVVQRSDHPLHHAKRNSARRPGYPDQLHRPGGHRNPDP